MTNIEIRAIASARKEMEKAAKILQRASKTPILQDKSGVTFTYRGIKYTR